MFKLISMVTRMMRGAARAKAVRLGAFDFDAHVEHWGEVLYVREGERQHAAWLAERAEIAAEWAVMPDERKARLKDDYERAMWAGQLPVGEGRYYDHWIAEHAVGYVGD